MGRKLRSFAIAAVLVLGAATLAFAQGTAQISGTVRDESGGVLPGVDVTATNTNTGATRTVITDSGGQYVLPNLPLGPYRLQAMLPGFRAFERTGIVLQVGASPTINITLPLGALTETVSVQAAAPLVDTQRAGIGEVIESERIVELPLNGRNPVDLIELAGAAVQTGTASTRSMQGSSGGIEVAVAGGLGSSTAYILDGAMHNNPYDNLNLPFPFPDALQEFRVETGALGATSGVHTGASVNAVTKSGTNEFHGSAFEFWRNHRFNATNPFSAIGPDGERLGDGLNRNQFGGTLGGPIATDRLFFFGGYQGTFIRQTPTSNISFIPTAAMLAGDFTQVASAECAGRNITLRGPFVNNRVNPALFSPAALALVSRLPTTTDPCGQVVYGIASDQDEAQYVGRIDFQATDNNQFFGRYIATTFDRTPPLAKTDNILASTRGGFDNTAQSLTLGDTWIINSSTVNAVRFAWNNTKIHRIHHPLGFSGPDLGINMFSFLNDYFILSVSDAFSIGSGVQNEARFDTTTWQIADDVTMIRGNHQLSFGGNVARWQSFNTANVRSPGNFSIRGERTGMPLADFLLGNVSQFIQSNPNFLDMEQWYVGLHAADTWRVGARLTLNYGVRWEPFFPQQLVNGFIYNFDLDRFRQGIKSSVFVNAPAGFLYPGDEGFVGEFSGMQRQWDNLAPRVSAAWDVTGDGRTSLRAGYSLGYDFVNAQYHLNTSVAPPFGTDVRTRDVPLDDPFQGFPGGNPFPETAPGSASIQGLSPNIPFPVGGQFLAVDPDQPNTQKHSWNLVIERQIASNMAVSASYIGNYTDNLWHMKALNPGLFLGLGPCTLPDGTFHSVCSTDRNLDQRRALMFENPEEARFISGLDFHDASGSRDYHGLLLSFQRRSATGVSVSTNYTFSKCEGTPTTDLPNIGTGWSKPDDPEFDRGPCDSDIRHILNATMGVQTPELGDGLAAALAEGWRLSGILRARSGEPLTISLGNVDRAMTGITANQRADLVGNNPVLAEGRLWLNRSAFAFPALGTFGNTTRGQFRGPSRWSVDMVLARLFRFGGTQQVEVRAEAFNVFNTVRLDNPVTRINTPIFGRILGSADPRIMQFAVKYGF